jgi:RIO kinase 1
VPHNDRLPVRRSRFDDVRPRRRSHFDDDGDDPDDIDDRPVTRRRGPQAATRSAPLDDAPVTGDRWSTWDVAQRGPGPYPKWLVTDLAAVDTELGVVKTGKEADVHLVQRALPGTSQSCLLAAKRYRAAEHRLFHRDAAYLEGRRARRSRETRAMARRTAFGRDLLTGQWAEAEFTALGRLWRLGAPVPYPVQLHGTELLLEYLDEPDGQAAPRLAQLRPAPAQLRQLWDQLIDALAILIDEGLAHGDLSPFNLLVHRGRLVLIDLPQVVDLVANPQGHAFLARDVRIVTDWFTGHGLPAQIADAGLSRLRVTRDWPPAP